MSARIGITTTYSIRIDCDRCGARGPDEDVDSGARRDGLHTPDTAVDAVWRRMRARGWRMSRSRWVQHMCPACATGGSR